LRLFDARVARRSSLGVVIAVLFLPLLPLPMRAQEATDFFTVTPCRLYDTRWGAGPLAGGFDRWIPAGGYCGIPPDATAAALNFTSVDPTGDALLSAYPCCTWRPNVVNSVQQGRNLACGTILPLGTDGKLAAFLNAPYSTSSGLVVDVTGYLRPVSQVQQWREWEGTLTSPADYTSGGGDPYADVALDIRFTNTASGNSFVQPAVWDDEDLAPRIFKVYTALPAGIWTWAVDSCTRNGVSCLSGWTPSDGTIVVQSNTSSGNPLYDRGFVEQVEMVVGGQTVGWSPLQSPDGLKYPWIGDTAWLAPVREQDPAGATASWEAFLADRKSKGFTAVQIAPAIVYWNPALPQPAGFSFNKKSANCSSPIPNTDCWQPRKQYWDFFKNMVRKATEAKMVTVIVGVMNPTGINPGDTYPDIKGATTFAKYLKGRLGGYDVIFSPAFDDDPDGKNGTRGDLMNAVGLALRGKTPTNNQIPLTNHLSGGKSNCDEYYSFAHPVDPTKRWMTHYLFQSGHGGGSSPDLSGACAPVSTYSDVDNALMRARVMSSTISGYSPPMPAINAEGPYDAQNYTGTVNHPNVDTRYRGRQAGYLSMLSNAFGYTYGAYGVTDWNPPGGFFSLASAQDMSILKANFQGRRLISHTNWIGSQPATEKYKMVLASDETSFVLAYLPGYEGGIDGSSTTIQIASALLPCPVCPTSNSVSWSFKWENPVTGLNELGGSCSKQTGGPLTFTRPGNCGLNNVSCDWLLKVEKTGACPTAMEASTSSEAALQAWTDEDEGSGTSAVYAGATGPDGAEPILLSSAGKAFQLAPRVSRLGSHHLVVWQADGLDGSLYGIYGALVGPRGEVTGPFKINHYTEHDQREPAVAGRKAQEALVVWSSYGQDGDRGGIFGRLVRVKNWGDDPSLDNLGEEFPISEEGAGHQQRPQVVADAGGYWVAWETQDEHEQRRSLSVRRFDLNGRPQMSEVRFTAPAGEQRKLLTLDRPARGSVVLRWWRQDALGGLLEVLEQEVGLLGALGPVVPGKG
jgi:hypothetical protein